MFDSTITPWSTQSILSAGNHAQNVKLSYSEYKINSIFLSVFGIIFPPLLYPLPILSKLNSLILQKRIVCFSFQPHRFYWAEMSGNWEHEPMVSIFFNSLVVWTLTLWTLPWAKAPTSDILQVNSGNTVILDTGRLVQHYQLDGFDPKKCLQALCLRGQILCCSQPTFSLFFSYPKFCPLKTQLGAILIENWPIQYVLFNLFFLRRVFFSHLLFIFDITWVNQSILLVHVRKADRIVSLDLIKCTFPISAITLFYVH